MKGRRLGLVCALALIASSPFAFAQDSAVTPAPKAPKAAPAPKAAQPSAVAPPVVKPTTAEGQAAQEMASIAKREATCLREAADQVTLAVERLNSAPPEMLEKRRDELLFHVGVMDECRNIARHREHETGALAPFAEPPPAKKRGGYFRFGEILVESGAADAAVMVPPLRRNADRFTRCYERAGKRAANGKLRLRLRMVRGAGGARPSTVVIPAASRRDVGFHRCLANALMDTPFPHSLVGSDVSFMMGFSNH